MKIHQMFNQTQKESYNLGDVIKFENSNLSGTGKVVQFGPLTTWVTGIKVINVQSGRVVKLSNNIQLMNNNIIGEVT